MISAKYKCAIAIALVTCGGSGVALLFSIAMVTSGSMSPTLKPKQHVLVVRISPLRSLCPVMFVPCFHRGDLVILQGPHGKTHVVKRIVALSGDRVHIKEGLLFLNGSAAYESYAYHKSVYLRERDEWPQGASEREITIPTNMLFVMGDNRSESTDSRIWGPVPISDVIGKVILRLP